MDHTPRLSLPVIMPAQAQKHITHNEAIQALDALVQPVVESAGQTAPPATPIEGEAYLVPAGATGAWSGHAAEIAAFQAGAWSFLEPADGWQVFVKAGRSQLVFDAGAWVPLASLDAGLPRLGVNTTADTTNRLAIAAHATLLTHDGAGHQLKLNKAALNDTASLLFQTGFAGRAEIGLLGDDLWRLKISANGTDWTDALTVDATTGTAVANGLRPTADNVISLGAADARWSAIWSATGTIQTSDQRQKCEIAPTDLGLDFICALTPVRFHWRSDMEQAAAPTVYGLIAQDVASVLDGRSFAGHVLSDPLDPGSEQGLRYDAFIAPLIAAVQQLAAQLALLEHRVRSSAPGSAP